MALGRRVETFIAAYFGTTQESTAFTAEVMDDLDAFTTSPAKTNFFIQNRAKQYFGFNDTITVKNGGTPVVNAGSAAYTLQRLGGIVRFNSPQVLTQTNDVQTLTGTSPAGNFLLLMTDENGVIWTAGPIAATATAANVDTAIDGATPSVVVGYTNPFSGTGIVCGAGPLNTTPITLTAGGVLAGQKLSDFTLNTNGITSGTVAIAHTTPGASGITVDGKYVPMYFLKGARNVNNNETAQKIDTTGSGDSYMTGVPGRPDATISFTIVTGPKVTNAAGKSVTLEAMLLSARRAGAQCVFAFVDDTSDPMQPRDVAYAFIGTANKTRQLNTAVERAIDAYLAIPDDGSLPLTSIDYIA